MFSPNKRMKKADPSFSKLRELINLSFFQTDQLGKLLWNLRLINWDQPLTTSDPHQRGETPAQNSLPWAEAAKRYQPPTPPPCPLTTPKRAAPHPPGRLGLNLQAPHAELIKAEHSIPGGYTGHPSCACQPRVDGGCYACRSSRRRATPQQGDS